MNWTMASSGRQPWRSPPLFCLVRCLLGRLGSSRVASVAMSWGGIVIVMGLQVSAGSVARQRRGASIFEAVESIMTARSARSGRPMAAQRPRTARAQRSVCSPDPVLAPHAASQGLEQATCSGVAGGRRGQERLFAL
jgi:hypothetical protein